jgi:ketosteroid isomerase-like protein
MDAQGNKQFVADGFQMFQNKDLPGLVQRFTDDIEWVSTKVPGVSFSAAVHKGKEAIGRYFLEMGKAQEALSFEIRKMIAEGNEVVVVGEARWLVRATGKEYVSPWVQIFTFGGDIVARVQAFNDTAAIQAAYQS